MIIDHISHAKQYDALGIGVRAGLHFLARPELHALEKGRYDLPDSGGSYALVQEHETKLRADAKWEAHRKMIDLQFMVRGRELMGYANITRLKMGEYHQDNDCCLGEGDGAWLRLDEQHFMILFPQDGHMPSIAVAGPEKVRKVVVKIPVETVDMQQADASAMRILPEEGHPLAVPCTVYSPGGTPGRTPGLVIHLYGSGASHTDYNLMRPPYAQLRRGLREAGYWVVVPDLGPAHWMNPRSVATLDAIIAGMVARGEGDPRRVHLLGTSMGGVSALIYSSQRQDVLRSVCALFPMTDFEAWVAEQPGYLAPISQAHGFDPANPGTALRALSPLNHVEDFVKIPVFLLHGDADAIVPVHHSRDFAAALRCAGGRVFYREVPGGGHDDDVAAGWQDDILKFLLNIEANTGDIHEHH